MRKRHRSTKTLAKLEVFKGCDQRELTRLVPLMTHMAFPAGRVLTRAHEGGREFFIVVDRYAEVRRDGKRIASLGPGSFFGEMGLLDGGVRTATVQARTAMELYVLSDREFRQLITTSPNVARNMLRTMSQRLRDTA